jgi:hypothetical protein
MVNRKKHEGEKLYNGQQRNHWPLYGFSVDHCMVSLLTIIWFICWPLYGFSVGHCIVSHLRDRETIQWSTEKPYNGQQINHTMVNRETIQWSKEKPYNGKHCMVSLLNIVRFLCWPLYGFSVDHCMVSLLKKHEGEKPYNGQQKKNAKETNHTMANRQKHEGDKPYNNCMVSLLRVFCYWPLYCFSVYHCIVSLLIQWPTEKQ